MFAKEPIIRLDRDSYSSPTAIGNLPRPEAVAKYYERLMLTHGPSRLVPNLLANGGDSLMTPHRDLHLEL